MDAVSIIQTLGGPAQISRETGWPLTTIDGWKRANRIPAWRLAQLGEVARRAGAADVLAAIGISPVDDLPRPIGPLSPIAAPPSGGTADDLAPLLSETPQGADVLPATSLAGAEADPSAPAAFSDEGAGGVVQGGAA